MADILRNQWEKVLSLPNPSKNVDNYEFFNVNNPCEHNDDELMDLKVEKWDLEDALSELKSAASSGPDGIPNKLLKAISKDISLLLKIILQKSLKEGNFPKELKKATVIPVHKGESRNLPETYRTVSLTSTLGKSWKR